MDRPAAYRGKISSQHHGLAGNFLPARPWLTMKIWKGYNRRNMSKNVLIVDDEIEICLSLKELLEANNYSALYTTEPERALELLQNNRVDLVLVDIRMPKLGGIDLLKLIKSRFSSIPVIIISGHATIDTAVKAMKYGACNLFTKPIEFEALLHEIQNLLSTEAVKDRMPKADKLISQSSEIRKLLDLVHKAAPTDATVLITGESGTGKELIANTLHSLSPRNDMPYVKVNCAAIPETLLESEIFGHEKGAFTDAKTTKKGLFETAHGGTLFLDEIGDMSLNTQAKMLRILQEQQFTRVGGREPIRADCRLVAATNKDLTASINRGGFREDLFYRLSVIHLELPPLRDRREDIIPLAEYFLSFFNQVYRKDIQKISPEVRSLLERHSWPGNIRELKNFIERSVIFSSGSEIDISIIPDQYKFFNSTGKIDTGDFAEQYENKGKEIILEALKKSNWVKQDAARLLRIDRKTLYNRMKKFNIQ
jgi:two-component system, NtrC family, response regulator AtoC